MGCGCQNLCRITAIQFNINKKLSGISELRTPKCQLRNPSPVPLNHEDSTIVAIFILFYIFLVGHLTVKLMLADST